MANTKVYNMKGEVVGDIALKDEVFGLPYNEALIHQVVVAQAANARQGTHSALNRDEVRGGGIKPWKQKGTGRARQGSIRSPQWTGGGVVFAKKPRDFSKAVNIKARRNALKSALSYKAQNDEIFVLDELTVKEAKTKEIVGILGNFKFTGKRVLIVLPEKNDEIVRATNNLEFVSTTYASLLNVTEVVKNANIVTTKAGIGKIEEVCSL